VLWFGSISLETWASYSKTRPGVYDGNVLAIKHVVTGVPAILYGVWSIRLYRLLSAKMRDATAAAGGSSVQRRDANGVLILSQEDRVRRQIRQYLIAIWLFLFMMVAYKVTASVFWYCKTYYLTPPCSFLGVLEIPYVLGIIIGFSWAAGHRGSSPNKEFEYTAAIMSLQRSVSHRFSRVLSFKPSPRGTPSNGSKRGFGSFMSPRSGSADDLSPVGSPGVLWSGGSGLDSSRGSMDGIMEDGEEGEEDEHEMNTAKTEAQAEASATHSGVRFGQTSSSTDAGLPDVGEHVSERGTESGGEGLGDGDGEDEDEEAGLGATGGSGMFGVADESAQMSWPGSGTLIKQLSFRSDVDAEDEASAGASDGASAGARSDGGGGGSGDGGDDKEERWDSEGGSVAAYGSGPEIDLSFDSPSQQSSLDRKASKTKKGGGLRSMLTKSMPKIPTKSEQPDEEDLSGGRQSSTVSI